MLFWILLAVSVFGVAAAVNKILTDYRRSRKAKKDWEDFKREKEIDRL